MEECSKQFGFKYMLEIHCENVTRQQRCSSRPGRPPKRSLGVAMQENSRLLPHSVHGLLSPGLISPSGLTAAAMAEAMKLQKMKLMAMNSLHGTGSQNGTESENEELNSNAGACTMIGLGQSSLAWRPVIQLWVTLSEMDDRP
ncbi:UNVERIFIED_CONTAM: hypothetical protein FKN15_056470 [Acipenser sinensis]